MQTLPEIVKFTKSDKVRSGIKSKYGNDAFDENTFGIEIEFKFQPEKKISQTHIFDRVPNGSWAGIVASLAPRAKDIFTTVFSEWSTKNAKYISPLKKQEILPLFIKKNKEEVMRIISSVDMLEFLYVHNPREYDIITAGLSRGIGSAEEFLKSRGQTVGETASKSDWNVGMDGENIEIRSRHLTPSDFGIVKDLLSNYVRGHITHGETSAHIHVGLPSKFCPFAMFALSSLVDEEHLKKDISQNRHLSLHRFAALRKSFETVINHSFINRLNNEKKDAVNIPLWNFYHIVRGISSKHTGTNLLHVGDEVHQHNTIEFRYFSSDFKTDSDISKFIKWIEYFILLPKVAQHRNRIKFGNLYYIKNEDDTVTVSLKSNPRSHVDFTPRAIKKTDSEVVEKVKKLLPHADKLRLDQKHKLTGICVRILSETGEIDKLDDSMHNDIVRLVSTNPHELKHMDNETLNSILKRLSKYI